MRITHLRLTAGILTALLVVLVVTDTRATAAQLPLAVIVLLLVPGYALLGLRRDAPPTSELDGLATAVGLSLAIIVISGLLVSLLPGGLTRTSGTLAIAALNLAALLTGAVRDRSSPSPRLAGPPVASKATAFAVIAAGVVVAAAITFSVVNSRENTPPSYTELAVRPLSSTVAQISVVSHEAEKQRFDVVASEQDPGAPQVSKWSVTLVPGQSWSTRAAPLRPFNKAGPPLRITLRRVDDLEPYRRASLRRPLPDAPAPGRVSSRNAP